MVLRYGLIALALLAVIVLLGFAALGYWSHHGASNGAGTQMAALDSSAASMPSLMPCGSTPNCVCSEGGAVPGDDAYIAPIDLPAGDPERQWAQIREALLGQGATILTQHGYYLHATVTSPMFRFVDDLELRREGDQLHLRSASRVGYSDLGANRARVETLKADILRRLQSG